MEWFCSEEDRSALKARGKRLTAAFRVLVAAAVIVFIVICLLVRTENAGIMHPVLLIATTLLGWACILVYQLGIRETRTQLGHLDMLLQGEKEFREGRVTLTREAIRIPKSIRIRKVLLDIGEEEPLSLNLDENWVPRLPPDGSLVRLAATHSYIAGAEVLEKAAGEQAPRRKPARSRKAAQLVPLLGIWLLAAVIFGSFVFYQITDTDPAHKITIYVDGEVRNEAQLAARLEKELSGAVRMVRIHPFRYAMFGSEALKTADLFIVPDSEKDQFAEWFVPGESTPVYQPGTGLSVAGNWFIYRAGETYRLYTGAASPHLADGLARRAAELLLTMTDVKEENP